MIFEKPLSGNRVSVHVLAKITGRGVVQVLREIEEKEARKKALKAQLVLPPKWKLAWSSVWLSVLQKFNKQESVPNERTQDDFGSERADRVAEGDVGIARTS